MKPHHPSFIPTLVFLYSSTLLVGFFATNPIFSATSLATDDDMFAPGRLMFLEHLRLALPKIGAATTSGALLFLLGQTALVFGKCRLSALIVDRSLRETSYRPLLSRAGAFSGIFLLQILVIAATIAGWVWWLLTLPIQLDSLAPDQVALALIAIVGCIVMCVAWLCFFELWRLSLFHRGLAQSSLRAAFRVLRRDLPSLLAFRGARTCATLAFSALALALASSPSFPGPWGAALTFVCGQLLVVAALLLDVVWLSFAGRCVTRSDQV